MYMIPINLWSVVVSHMVIGRKKPSSYVFVRGGATVVNVACSLDRTSSQEGGREVAEDGRHHQRLPRCWYPVVPPIIRKPMQVMNVRTPIGMRML
jgi:hypothetical protein